MSLVGPRPIVEDEVIRYADKIDHYAAVRPGITGLWQVSGRSDVDYDQRVQLDCRYVREWSFLGDMFILAKTVKVVALRTGSR
ncbi:putative sugar transferase EpsL [compost metagenome]